MQAIQSRLRMAARAIGQGMMEVTVRGPELASGSILNAKAIERFSDAYERQAKPRAQK